MAEIQVSSAGGDQYRVVVIEGKSSSEHTVRVTDDMRSTYGGDASAEALLEASFEFLLEREPKESIMSRFDLPVIERYFPEYPGVIRGRVGSGASG